MSVGLDGENWLAKARNPFLADRGWRVTVYCQEEESVPVFDTEWSGVRRVHVGVGWIYGLRMAT